MIIPCLLLLAANSAIAGSCRRKTDNVVSDHASADQAFIRHILNEAHYANFSGHPTEHSRTPRLPPLAPGLGPLQNFSVGIVGGGICGLYAALLCQSLNIHYNVLEAQNRAGGRIWTYYFDEAKWKSSSPGDPAYYDYYVCILQHWMTYRD